MSEHGVAVGCRRAPCGSEHRARWFPTDPFTTAGQLSDDIAQPISFVPVEVPFGFEGLEAPGKLLISPLQFPVLVFQLLQFLLLLLFTLLLPLPESCRGPCVALPFLVCLLGPLMDVNGDHDLVAMPRGNGQKWLPFAHAHVSPPAGGH